MPAAAVLPGDGSGPSASVVGSGNVPAGHSRTPCLSTTGHGPVPAATIASYGSVVSIHSGESNGCGQSDGGRDRAQV